MYHAACGLSQRRPRSNRAEFEIATMSVSNAETFVANAKQQVSQRDINSSFVKAITELTKEVKRLEDEIRRVRRDVLVSRRF
jgi:hypothetical protein